MNLSQQKIVLGKSHLYTKLSLLIYLSALPLLYYSSCWFPLKILLALILVAQFIRIYRNPIPYPKFRSLSCTAEGWTIHTKDEKEIFYEKGRIVIDAALFFLLELSAGRKQKYIVVFFDQLDRDCYRWLRVKEKIQLGTVPSRIHRAKTILQKSIE